jgi:hypothetical protein
MFLIVVSGVFQAFHNTGNMQILRLGIAGQCVSSAKTRSFYTPAASTYSPQIPL